MPTKYRPITRKELAKEIGIAVLIALIFAPALGGVMSILFHSVGGIFDPTPNAPPDCTVIDVLGGNKTLAEHQACKANSNSFDAKFARLESKIPWFWIAFFLIAWAWLRNPLKGRIWDDSEDVTYTGQWGMFFLGMLIFQIMFFICLWALLIRDLTSFIALGIGIAVTWFWHFMDKWLLKTYGQTKLERRSK